MTINASIVQDAFHYALAANGGSWQGLESTFVGRDASMTRTQYMRAAYRAAQLAGVSLYTAPKRLADVPAMLEAISFQSRAADVWAHGGCRLCPVCRNNGVDGKETHCVMCPPAHYGAPVTLADVAREQRDADHLDACDGCVWCNDIVATLADGIDAVEDRAHERAMSEPLPACMPWGPAYGR